MSAKTFSFLNFPNMNKLIFRIFSQPMNCYCLYFSHYSGLKVLQVFNIFNRKKSHLSPALFEELPFKMKKKTSNCIIFKFCKKKASARNVLLGCIFLYIHICFYTTRIFHPCHRFQNRGKSSVFLLQYSKCLTLSLVCQESCCKDASDYDESLCIL